MEVGKRLIGLREKHGIARNALAKKSGVALSFINSIERGDKEPTVHTLRRLCDSLGITLAEFFAEDNLALKTEPPEVRQIYNKVKNLPLDKLKVLNAVLDSWD